MGASVQICILVAVPKIDADLASATLLLCPCWERLILQHCSKLTTHFQKQSMLLPTKQLLHNGAQAAEQALPC